MTTELGQSAGEAENAVPRQRGAHAAAKSAKSGLLRRRPKGALPTLAARPRLAEPPPVPQPAPVPSAPPEGPQPLPVPQPPPSPRPPQTPRRVPSPRPSPATEDATQPLPVAVIEATPRAIAGPARSAFADIAAALVVLAVVPLALLQVPDAIEWAIPAKFASPQAMTSLLRASGLALSAMAIAAPLGGLAVRRFRGWPVLMAGLGVFGVADIMANATRTIAQVGIDRSLHGAAAGVMIVAATALAAERPAKRHPAQAAWLAACAVGGLAAASEVMRYRLSTGNWHAALQPFPALTGVALGLTALHALLADGALTARTRITFPAAERARLALLVTPIAGLCAIAIAVTYGRGDGLIAAALACAISLAGLALMTGRSSAAGWCAVACPVTGFTLAPAAGAATDLLRITPHSGLLLAMALTGATAGGALLVAMLPERHRDPLIGCGLLLAATGYGASFFTGLTGAGASTGRTGAGGQLFALACVPLAGGLTMALAAALRKTGAAGAVCGIVLLLAGVLAGYLADGAIELQAVAAADRSAAAVHAALLTADARWDIVAAIITAAVAVAVFARLLTRVTSTEVDH